MDRWLILLFGINLIVQIKRKDDLQDEKNGAYRFYFIFFMHYISNNFYGNIFYC